MFRTFLEHFLPLDYVLQSIDPYLDLSDEDASNPQIVRLHRRILRWAIITGSGTSFGWTAGLLVVVLREFNPNDPDEWLMLLAMPPLALTTFLAGTFVDVSAACAITPTWFLLGSGGRWIKLIGTRNIVVARIVCVSAAVLSSPILLLPVVISVCILVFG